MTFLRMMASVVDMPDVDHTGAGSREAAKRAAPPCMLAVCTDERHDLGRGEPSQPSTETEGC